MSIKCAWCCAPLAARERLLSWTFLFGNLILPARNSASPQCLALDSDPRFAARAIRQIVEVDENRVLLRGMNIIMSGPASAAGLVAHDIILSV